MELEQAKTLAQKVVDLLSPHCEEIEVAGSIRRGRPYPQDIDIVLIPAPWGRSQIAQALFILGVPKRRGEKLQQHLYKGAQVDLYFATPETWAMLLLIHTDSQAHNIKLCGMAKNRGWHLFADGKGLFNESKERIAGNTEESIFEVLGLKYAEPWERER